MVSGSRRLPHHPILKPQLHGTLKTTIFDEEYGSRLARKLNLASFDMRIVNFAGLSTLAIERYDRSNEQHIHQEDFNQILGAQGNEKYQEIGGTVGLRRIATVLQNTASRTDLNTLARMTILSAAIGNLDMHAKNLGLLHPLNGPTHLAPAYDVVPQAHMDNDGKLALSINKVYRHRDVTGKDLSSELKTWGLRHPDALISETLDEIESAVSAETPLPESYSGLQEEITGFVHNLREGRAAGTPNTFSF